MAVVVVSDREVSASVVVSASVIDVEAAISVTVSDVTVVDAEASAEVSSYSDAPSDFPHEQKINADVMSAIKRVYFISLILSYNLYNNYTI